MADKITSERIVEVTHGYAIEFSLPDGERARLVSKCRKALLKTAHELYASKQTQPGDGARH